jgi:hypothetical protein
MGPNHPPMTDVFAFLTGKWHDLDFVKSKIVEHKLEPIIVDTSDFTLDWTADMVASSQMGGFLKQLSTMTWTPEQKAEWGPKFLPAVGAGLREKYGDKPFSVKYSAVVAFAKKPE